MKRLLLAALVAAFSYPAFADQANVVATCSSIIYDVGQPRPTTQDVNGNLCVAPSGGGGGATASQVQGNVAHDSPDTGFPVGVGGVAASTTPTSVTAGDRVRGWFALSGAQVIDLITATSSPGADALNQASLTTTNGAASTNPLGAAGYVFNGINWDRHFTCSQSAIVNVTAAATTELVPLTAAQVIRVCSIAVTGSAASTTATFVYGTGANCATGQTALTGAMRVDTGSPVALSGVNGSLFRTASANALCLTAATGNVTGFVTYAKF